MRKVVAAINMTLDGFCDHTAVDPDAETHDHFTALLKTADVVLYGRITYELMKFWQPIAKNPTGEKSMNEFAVAMDNIPKVVFSRTLEDTEWETARIATKGIEEEVAELKRSGDEASKDILVGSPSLITTLTELELIDEYQIVIHPVIAGGGLPLFKNNTTKVNLKLLKIKTFGGGAVAHYYGPLKK